MNLPSQTHPAAARVPNGISMPSDPATTARPSTTSTPALAQVNTSVGMTVTSAFVAMSASSSSRNSPLSHLPALRTQASVIQERALDNGLSPQFYGCSSPSVLPRSAASERPVSDRSPSPHARTPYSGAMSEALGKGPGIIRRLSRGAQKQLRRRASTNQSMRMRGQSAGPTLVRRRSDSNGASDIGQDMSDLDLDAPADMPDDLVEEPHYPSTVRGRKNALGISVGRTSNASSNFEGGIAPAISAILEEGTWVTKATKKSLKRVKIRLDSNSARVCWHPTNSAKSFFIDDVREIRLGAESRNTRDDVQIPDEQEGCWVTIVFDAEKRSKGRAVTTMHLIAGDEYITKLWADALNTVTRERVEIMNALSTSIDKSEKSMALAWRRAMARKGPDADEYFTLDDARLLCRNLEINCSDGTVRTHFTRSDLDRSGLLNYERFRDFVNSFKERKDIQNLFRNIKYGTDLEMDRDTFLDFLKNEQCVDVDKDPVHWEGVFDKYARTATNQARLPDAEPVIGQKTMNRQGFQNFMTSAHTSPLIPVKRDPRLDRPLNEYFISSSHNTYLLGRQVAGASSVEGYIAALVKGCRCVEIDCWDGDDGRPMVTHGRTMTTKISFADCVSVIAKYAFHTSPYPLIVSLEVHCGSEQQLAMVRLMEKLWEGILLTQAIMTDCVSLPSPDELRHKILVKIKSADDEGMLGSRTSDSLSTRSRGNSLGSSFVRVPSIENQSITSSPYLNSPAATTPTELNGSVVYTPRGWTTYGIIMTPSSSAEDSDNSPASAEKPKRRSTSKIIPELGKLGVYTQGISFKNSGGFTAPEAKRYNHVFSFGENTLGRLSVKNTDTKALLDKHNMRYLMRVYPGPRRIDSSNFNPLQAWRRGVQMAALNWQTYDVNMQVNDAMFAAGSDRSGYVLKPEELRHAKHLPIADTIAEPADRKEKKGRKVVKFSVDLISAQRLPRPRNHSPEVGMNPYLAFEMYAADDKARGIATAEGGTDASARDGTSGLGAPLRKLTRVMDGNGFDPIFNTPISMTVETKYPSLVFVRWTVWNSPDKRANSSNNVLLATFTAKLSSLQQGYRHIPLFNPHGEQYRDAKLFVKIRKETPVAVIQEDSAYGMLEPSASPRPEPVRSDRSWTRRIFSRNPSEQRRRKEQYAGDSTRPLSRTSSMDRESVL